MGILALHPRAPPSLGFQDTSLLSLVACAFGVMSAKPFLIQGHEDFLLFSS